MADAKKSGAAAAATPAYPFHAKNGMIYRKLGATGLKVSVLTMGTWMTFDDDRQDVADALTIAAIKNGVNTFDSAEDYYLGKSELALGRALKKAYAQCGIRRSDLVVTTKLLHGGDGPNQQGLSHKHIMEGLDASLERLDMPYVDVVFAHRPDPTTPLEETVRAFTIAIRQGKAFYWGTSEWPADMITEAVGIAKNLNLIAPVVEQPQYNMLNRTNVEANLARLYQTIGLGTTTFSPLASGLLTGKYNSGIPDGSRLTLSEFADMRAEFEASPDELVGALRALADVAKKVDATLPQLAIAWCLKTPGVSSVIIGASKTSQLAENVKALAVLPKLTKEILAEIDGVIGSGTRAFWTYQRANGTFKFAMPYGAAEVQDQTDAWNAQPSL